MIKLTLPFPPSLNRMYRMWKGRYLISKEGRLYKESVELLARTARIKPLEGDVNITVRLFRPAKRGDADNFSKVMLDALQGHAYQNDGQITELHVYRADDKMNPRVEVEVRAA